MITNKKQAFAQELKQRLNDTCGSFGMYCGLIERYGEQSLRQLLSEVMYQQRTGKIDSAVKVFMYRVGKMKQ